MSETPTPTPPSDPTPDIPQSSFFEKIIENLPMSKMTGAMAYNLAFSTLMIVCLIIFNVIKKDGDFPSAWDNRMVIIGLFIVFFSTLYKPRKKEKT